MELHTVRPTLCAPHCALHTQSCVSVSCVERSMGSSVAPPRSTQPLSRTNRVHPHPLSLS